MKFQGIITPLVTPFDEQQELDLEATRRLVNKLIDAGIHGLFILGTNGEFHVLTREEKILVAKTVIEEANGRVPVYVGAGENSTKATISLAKEMAALGADALSIITPHFLAPNKEELIQHYKTIATSVELPIILYNIPKNTGVNLTPDVVAILADVQNIVAIKDSSGDMVQMKAYIEACTGKDMEFLVGSDAKMLEAFQLGACAAVAGTSNVITAHDLHLYEAFQRGDIEVALRLQQDLERFRSVNKLGSVPSIMKKALAMVGTPVGAGRLPVSEPNAEVTKQIEDMLTYYHLLN